MKKTKMEKGITLTALIITIVVLLILAAVAISSITNDGILGYAENVAKDYNQAVVNEQDTLDLYEGLLSNKLNGDKDGDYTVDTTIPVPEMEFEAPSLTYITASLMDCEDYQGKNAYYEYNTGSGWQRANLNETIELVPWFRYDYEGGRINLSVRVCVDGKCSSVTYYDLNAAWTCELWGVEPYISVTWYNGWKLNESDGNTWWGYGEMVCYCSQSYDGPYCTHKGYLESLN